MAITGFSGAELGTTDEFFLTSGTVSVSGSNVNTGSFSLRSNPSNGVGYVNLNNSAMSTRFTAYLYIDSSPDQETVILGYNQAGYANIRLTSDRYLKAYNGDTLKGSGSTQLNEDTYYRISGSIDGDSANDPFKVYIDGVEEISDDMDGVVNGWGGASSFRVGASTLNTTADLYFDDIVCDDISSTDDLGNIVVAVAANPNADGDANDFDSNTGGETYHFEYYDNPPGEDPDSDYVYHQAKTVVQDIANLDSCSDIGLGGTDVIKAVKTCARWKLAKTGSGTPAYIYVKDNGSGYTTQLTDSAAFKWDFRLDAVMPNGGGAWTQDRFNAFQAGLQSTGENNYDTYLACILVMVAYTPAAVGDVHVQSTETVGISDSLLKSARLYQFISSTIGLGETALSRRWSVRPLAETVGLIDSLFRRGTRNPLLTVETIDISDSAVAKRWFTKLITDSITLIDSIFHSKRRMRSVRPMAETVEIAETSLGRKWSVRVLAETVNLIDSLFRHGVRDPLLTTETVGITETAIKVSAAVRIIAETIGIAEASVRRFYAVQLTAEIIGLVETALKRAWSIKPIAETVDVNDGSVKRAWSTRFAADTVNIIDSAVRSSGFVKLISETINIVDSALRTAGFVRLASETVNIADSFVSRFQLLKLITETVNIADSAIFRAWAVRIKSEAIGITESVVRRSRAARIAAEVVSIAEIYLRRLLSVRLVTEQENIAETSVRASRLVKLASEVLGISEDAVRAQALIKMMTDALSIVDSFVARLRSVRIKTETVNIVDSWVAAFGITAIIKMMAETISIADGMLGITKFMKALRVSASRLAITRLPVDRVPFFRWMIRRFQ